MAWKNLKIVASASGNRQKDKAGLQNFANGSSDGQKRPSVSKRTGLLDKVSFESGNFLEDLCPGEEKYDTILWSVMLFYLCSNLHYSCVCFDNF